MQHAKFLGVGIFISTLFLYWLTSYPTVAYIDSGELAVVNWTLGIAHPTGYPLYTLLGRLFALLPFELISTQNLFGSLCTSASATILFLILWRVIQDVGNWQNLTAAALAILFGVAPLIWSQGSTNEVYSLHLLMMTVIVWCIAQGFQRRIFLLVAFFFGLSFGNHMSTILLTPMLLIYLFHQRRELQGNRVLLPGAAALLLLGISIYLYLPIRSSLELLFNWGEPYTWDNFIRHVSGWQYQVWMFDQDFSALIAQLGNFATLFYRQFPLPFWPAILWGLYAGWRRHPQLMAYLLVLLITNIIYSLNFSILDIENYLLPSVLSLIIIGALGLVDIVERVPRRTPVTAAFTALLIAWGLIANWQEQDNSDNYAALDGVHNFYKSVNTPALIFCANWDYVSPWYYSHYYLKEEPQVLVVDNELLRRSWYFDWVKQADPDLYSFIEPEMRAFLPHVQLFEAGEPYDEIAIEGTYQALLKKFTDYDRRRFYFDQSSQLRFQLNGDIRLSGKLFRLVRPGENFTPPLTDFIRPRFGKPRDALNGRERWHIQLFEGMSVGPQGPSGP